MNKKIIIKKAKKVKKVMKKVKKKVKNVMDLHVIIQYKNRNC